MKSFLNGSTLNETHISTFKSSATSKAKAQGTLRAVLLYLHHAYPATGEQEALARDSALLSSACPVDEGELPHTGTNCIGLSVIGIGLWDLHDRPAGRQFSLHSLLNPKGPSSSPLYPSSVSLLFSVSSMCRRESVQMKVAGSERR